MDEPRLNSSDLTPDIKSTSSAHIEGLQKIYRKGDKIYHVNDENVTMLKEFNDLMNVTNDLTDGQVDQVSSGESLYKTFSFDSSISKEETEKCISFWRSVVEKNLEPIKCTIIESLNNSEPRASTSEKKDKQKEKLKKKSVSTITSKRDQRHSVWFDILENLQQNRLNKTKLMLEKRCRICEYTTADPYETDDPNKGLKDHLGELDNWIPQSNKGTRQSGGSKSPERMSIASSGSKKRYSVLSGDRRVSIGQRSVRSGDPGAKEIIGQVIVEGSADIEGESIVDEPLLARVKEASNKIQYIDAIEMKKREQIYSKWRHNKVEKLCNCFRMECDCNTNPAVVAIINNAESRQNGTDFYNNYRKPYSHNNDYTNRFRHELGC